MGNQGSKSKKPDGAAQDSSHETAGDKDSKQDEQAAPRRRRQRDVQQVAVVGAGYSGVVTAAHLSRYGFGVRVFERSSDVGGVWRFDPRVPPDPPYPNERPEAPFSERQEKGDGEGKVVSPGSAEMAHAPPGPCYAGLRNNVPTTLMRSTITPWPSGTEEFVTHDDVEAYIRSIVDAAGIRPLICFDTAVLEVRKDPGDRKWTVRTRTLRRGLEAAAEGAAADEKVSFEERDWAFDAVVCASGHYQVPRIPDIPGLAAWKARRPSRVGHSRGYRDAGRAGFRGCSLLLVGAAVSSLDIVREAAAVAAKVYQSSRGGRFDIPASALPNETGNVERVAGIARFEPPPQEGDDGSGDGGGEVHLTDGRVLRGVDQVVLATGYVTSYPYLGGRLQRPGLALAEARRARDRDVVVAADGVVSQNLHRDMFYIPDPTLAFVGVPYYNSTFSFFDTQAQVVARVLAGEAALPPRAEMEAEFDGRWLRRVKGKRGGANGREETEDPEAAALWGKDFHSLLGLDEMFTDQLLAWVNPQVEAAGGTPIVGPDEAWRARYRQMREERAWRWPIEEEED